MYTFPNYKLLVFSKSPTLGKAKTRMQPNFSPLFSQKLHCLLVDSFLKTSLVSKLLPLELWLAGDPQDFKQYLSQWSSLSIFNQQGGDLGERMFFAVDKGLAESEGVIVVGTDCPFIDELYLQKACSALKEVDVVLGPANDGGYVLIGLNKPYRELFEGIKWGSDSVLAATIKKIDEMQLRYCLLPPLNDIDRPEDIQLLQYHPDFTELLNEFH